MKNLLWFFGQLAEAVGLLLIFAMAYVTLILAAVMLGY